VLTPKTGEYGKHYFFSGTCVWEVIFFFKVTIIDKVKKKIIKRNIIIIISMHHRKEKYNFPPKKNNFLPEWCGVFSCSKLRSTNY